jgi:hypothetical protein
MRASADLLPLLYQRAALETCQHLCKCVGSKSDVVKVLQVVPLLCKCLAMDDEQIVQKASQCFCRIVENFSPLKHNGTHNPPGTDARGAGAQASPVADDSAEDDIIWRIAFLRQVAQEGLVGQWLRMAAGKFRRPPNL